MTKDEALKLALEALENHEGNYKLSDAGCDRHDKAITAIKQARSAPVQEPVAWIEHHKGGDNLEWDNPGGKCTPLYTTPPAAKRQWVGLTDEAIWSEYQTLWSFHPAEEPRMAKDIAKFARAIEAKLKEKNT